MCGRIRVGLVSLSLLYFSVSACASPPRESPRDGGRGGAVVVSVRSEPRTFNRLLARDVVSVLVSELTQAKLVRIDPASDQVEPWLADGWTASEDGLTYIIDLPDDVRFSDGALFSSADVLFSFEAVYDEALGSPVGDSLLVGGEPLAVEAPDTRTVVVTFPAAFGPGLRLLDNLMILPRHLLAPLLADGSLASAWGVTAAPDEIVGLGPFVLDEYVTGQRMVFTRNPEYWRQDADGVRLPYLERLTVEIVPDQNAEILRLEAGEIDFTISEVRAEDYTSIERAVETGQLQLFDRGISLDADFLWFNLTARRALADASRPWLRRPEFRRAVAHAVDREAFGNTVYLGLADPIYGPVTPGNRTWFSPDAPAVSVRPGAGARTSGGAWSDGSGRRRAARRCRRGGCQVHAADAAGEHGTRAGHGRLAGGPRADRPHGGRRAAGGRGAHRADPRGGLRRGLLRHARQRHRPGGQSGLLAQFRGVPSMEPQPGLAGDRVGSPDRRPDATAGGLARPRRARSVVCRRAEDLRRVPAGRVLFGAPRLLRRQRQGARHPAEVATAPHPLERRLALGRGGG